MGLIGQVSLARAGTALELEFDVEDLKDVIENQARPFGHVTLHPGDFSNLDEEIQIPEGVAVTILPGADVEYTDDFRDPGCPDNCAVFDHDGNPNDSNQTHPLSGDFKRYDRPNFTGHVENIADLNLASEWSLEATPQIWTAARAGADDEIDVLAGDADENLRTLSFRGGPGAEVAVQEDTREIQISLDPDDFVQSINFNRLLFEENNNSVGNLSVSHESIKTDFNPSPGIDVSDPSNGAVVLRNLAIHESEPGDSQQTESDGHVDAVEEAHLLGVGGAVVNVSEVDGGPDEITIDASGASGSGVTSISTGSDLQVDQGTGNVKVSHNVSSDESTGNGGGTVIQEVGTSSAGHVTSVSTTNLDSRYVKESGDTMGGSLTINGSLGFDSGTSVTDIRTDIRNANNSTHNSLATERAIRDAIQTSSGNTFIDGTNYSDNSNELTLNRNDGTDLTATIKPKELFHANDTVAITAPNGNKVRFFDNGSGKIFDVSTSPQVTSFFDNNDGIDQDGSTPLSSIDGIQSLGITADRQLTLVMDANGTSPTIRLGGDSGTDRNIAMGAENEIRMAFDRSFEDSIGGNSSSGLQIECRNSGIDFASTGGNDDPRIILSNNGYIDVPTRLSQQSGTDRPDPPPKGYIRFFAEAESGDGGAAQMVFLEANGGGADVDPG
mgnify:CR=1 FL=1